MTTGGSPEIQRSGETTPHSPGLAPGGPADRRFNVRSAVAAAHAANVELTRFLYADHGGVIRGKSAATEFLAQRIESGIGHTTAMMAMTMLDTLQPVEGMGPVGEVRIKPDPATMVTLPYAPGAAAMLADLVRPDGQPWEACSRSFLKQAIADLAAAGYAALAAFEPEFTVGSREPDPDGGPDRLVPADDSLCYSATGFHQSHHFVMEVVRALNEQDLHVEHYYPELGPGQQEVSIRHADALRAADNHVLYRETVRGVAFRRGLWASLAPKPIADQAGNGTHLHISLLKLNADGSAGEPAFADSGDQYEYGLSALGYHFIGGLLAHLPALIALTCGSVNSYRRLQPQFWSSAYTCYGMDNREAAVRICSALRGDAASSVNLELKPSDSSANPYLALGAAIHAGLDGINREIDPGEPVNVDPATMTREERDAVGAARLPQSLGAALDALEADELLMTKLGPFRSAAYLAVKRAEAAAFAERDAAWECFQHFLRF
jgi:glutamine synthetase